MSADRVRVAFNAPTGSYIGYVADAPEAGSVTVTAEEVDQQNATLARQTFEHTEAARREKDGPHFVAGTLAVVPATDEITRRRLALEVAIAKFTGAGVLEPAAPAPAPATIERETPRPPAP